MRNHLRVWRERDDDAESERRSSGGESERGRCGGGSGLTLPESGCSLVRGFSRVQALGFTDADRHVQDAALLARWSIDHHAHIDDTLRELIEHGCT